MLDPPIPIKEWGIPLPADTTTLLNRDLRQRAVEFLVIATAGLTSESDLGVDILFNDRFVVMVGAQSKWAGRRKPSLADLIDEPWVLPPRDSIPGRHISRILRASGLHPPRPHMISFSLPLHHHLLATGRFVTLLPDSMLRFGKHLPLKRLSIDIPQSPYPIGIITLKNRTLGPMAQLFIERARKMAEPLARVPWIETS
jgi:DNA-binding transcriptional LysR family regulator